MRNFKTLKNNLKIEKVFVYFKDLTLENILLSLLLCTVLIVLTGNVIRVVANARSNYEIFAIESNGLLELKDKNKELERELEYVSSDEYKLLLLRNSSNLALPNEDLYTIKKDQELYEEEINLLDVSKKENFDDWWQILVQFLLG